MNHDATLANYQKIIRKKRRQIMVGTVPVGGDAPITVQTMTNTNTADVRATVKQIFDCAAEGAYIIRVSCPDEASTQSLKKIVTESPIPVVADIHFHYRRAIEAAQAGAACLRINPGNIGASHKVKEVIRAAVDNGCSMRIGVNAGSLERHLLEKYQEPCADAMVESALNHAKLLEENDFFNFKISVKASNVFLATEAYQKLITEAGSFRAGTVKSAVGMGMLLWSGIGDTIRVSLSDDPVEEVRVGFDILKSLNLRHRGVNIISCPSCARQQFDVIETVKTLEKKLSHITTPMTLSIIGCVVNGPGEAKSTNIGLTGGGKDVHQVYLSGVPHHRLKDENIVDHIVGLVEKEALKIEASKANVGHEAVNSLLGGGTPLPTTNSK